MASPVGRGAVRTTNTRAAQAQQIKDTRVDQASTSITRPRAAAALVALDRTRLGKVRAATVALASAHPSLAQAWPEQAVEAVLDLHRERRRLAVVLVRELARPRPDLPTREAAVEAHTAAAARLAVLAS